VDHFRTFHRNFETMIGTYNGAVKGWLWWLFFAAGRSVYTLRVPAVLLGAVALLLFYGWARRLYPPGTVLVALLLAATDPVYINTSRIDYGPVVLQRLLLMAGLLAGTKFVLAGPGVRRVGAVPGDGGIPAGVPGGGPRRRGLLPHGSYGWLVLSGFCFGLALWDKATFAWCLMALSAALLVLFPKEVLRRLRPLPIVVFLFFFCLGSLPLTAFNVRTKTRGTREVMHWESLDAKTCNEKWANFRLSFDGYYTYGMMGGDAFDEGVATVYDRTQWCLDALGWFAPQRGTLFTWVLAATMLIGVAAAWRRQRAVLFPLVLSLVHWVVVFVTRGAGGPHHTTLIYPIPHLAFAAAGAWLWQGAGRLPVAAAWVARRGLVLALTAVVMVQLAFDARQLSSFRQVRGTRMWSDAIYDLAGYLKANPPGLLVNMDWGFGFPLTLSPHLLTHI
jgi:4-amino-4-deoxy-L-arabinose transferase-like glycosyltransferase